MFARRTPTPKKQRSPKPPPPDLETIEERILNAKSPSEKDFNIQTARQLRRAQYWHGRVKPDFKTKSNAPFYLEKELKQVQPGPGSIGRFRRIHLAKLVNSSL